MDHQVTSGAKKGRHTSVERPVLLKRDLRPVDFIKHAAEETRSKLPNPFKKRNDIYQADFRSRSNRLPFMVTTAVFILLIFIILLSAKTFSNSVYNEINEKANLLVMSSNIDTLNSALMDEDFLMTMFFAIFFVAMIFILLLGYVYRVIISYLKTRDLKFSYLWSLWFIPGYILLILILLQGLSIVVVYLLSTMSDIPADMSIILIPMGSTTSAAVLLILLIVLFLVNSFNMARKYKGNNEKWAFNNFIYNIAWFVILLAVIMLAEGIPMFADSLLITHIITWAVIALIVFGLAFIF